MQTFAGYMPSSSPDVVDVSLRVLSMSAAQESPSQEMDLLVASAAECLRDYIEGIGRFGPPPPALSPPALVPPMSVCSSDYQTVASYLEAIVRHNPGVR